MRVDVVLGGGTVRVRISLGDGAVGVWVGLADRTLGVRVETVVLPRQVAVGISLAISALRVDIVLGGGAGTISGTIIGSLLFVGLTEALRVAPELRMIIYGLCLLVLVFWFKKGFAPLINRFWNVIGGAK